MSTHDLVQSSYKNCRVTSSHWFASMSQCPVVWNFTFFLCPFFAMKWCPTCCKWCPVSCKMMANVVSTSLITGYYIKVFFVKAVGLLLVSFTLSHFHKSSPTLLQEIYFIVFRMPNKWKLPEITRTGFGFKSLPHFSIVMDLDLIIFPQPNLDWNWWYSFELLRKCRFRFGTAGCCIDEFFKSLEIVYCVCLNVKPCLWPTKQVCYWVACHQNYRIGLTFIDPILFLGSSLFYPKYT